MTERICIILLANLIFFLKTIGYKYTSDDIPVLRASQKLTLSPIKKRWLQFIGDIRVSPQEDHFITIILHSVTSALVYLAFGANDISFVAALLFSVNPINNQGSVWISGRPYVWASIGMLSALAFPIIAPASILLVMYYPVGYFIVGALAILYPYMAIFMIIAGALHYRRIKGLVGNKVKTEMFKEDKRIQLKKLILVVKTFSFYTIHAIIPIKTTFYHSFMQSMAGAGAKKAYALDRFFYSGLALFGVFVWKIFFTPFDMVSFGLIWWVMGLSPFLNAFRISQEIAERYTYVPLPGLMFVLASLIQPYPVIISSFLSMYATKLWFYMDAFQDDYYLTEQASLNSPDSWFAWHIKALRRWDVQSMKEAMLFWTMAKNISPNEFKVLFNLATMLKVHNHHKEADEYYNLAIKNIPKGQEHQIQHLIDAWKQKDYKVII